MPVGVTLSESTYLCILQGSVDAGVLSSVSIDNSTSEAFAESDCEVDYLGLKLAALRYQDDILRMADTAHSA